MKFGAFGYSLLGLFLSLNAVAGEPPAAADAATVASRARRSAAISAALA